MNNRRALVALLVGIAALIVVVTMFALNQPPTPRPTPSSSPTPAPTARVYSVKAGDDQQLPMDLVAAGVSCYDPALAQDTCDFWQTTLANADPDNLWYRFSVEDGAAMVYYADDTPALDGGEGASTDGGVDQRV